MEDRKLAMSLLKEAGFEGQVSDITPWDERSLRAVDLIVYIGSIDSNILSDLIAIGGTKLVSVEAADAIVRRHPEFESDEIPAGFISPGVPTEEISTVRVTYYLTATSAFSQNKVARLTEAILTNRQFVARELNSVSVLTKPDVEKDAAVRVHPGASAYINDTERTFLEQYSDFFWGALLLFSGLGSIGAWWRAFYYREQVDDTAKMRDQLLALVDRVRIETDLARLKEVEGKADNLLRQTLDRHEAGILDDTHLSAFGLALDHFRQSVTSRKIELSSYSPEPPLAPH